MSGMLDLVSQIRFLDEGLYEVPSFTNPKKKYVVDLREKSCTCPDFTHRGRKCKHLKVVEENFGEQGECEVTVIREGAVGYKILYNGERW